jgi:hypothetical protein
MRCFTDKNKDKWEIEITVGTAKRVKADCGVDLINITDFAKQTGDEETPLETLMNDPALVVDVLFSLCYKQVAERGINGDAFGELFDYETIQGAVSALVEEIINFTPPVRRKVLMKMYEQGQRVMGEAELEAEKILENPEFEKEVEAFMKSSINTQESSE